MLSENCIKWKEGGRNELRKTAEVSLGAFTHMLPHTFAPYTCNRNICTPHKEETKHYEVSRKGVLNSSFFLFPSLPLFLPFFIPSFFLPLLSLSFPLVIKELWYVIVLRVAEIKQCDLSGDAKNLGFVCHIPSDTLWMPMDFHDCF